MAPLTACPANISQKIYGTSLNANSMNIEHYSQAWKWN